MYAAGVRLADGRVFRGKSIISNATRWDTFEGLMGESKMPESEKLFRWVLIWDEYVTYLLHDTACDAASRMEPLKVMWAVAKCLTASMSVALTFI